MWTLILVATKVMLLPSLVSQHLLRLYDDVFTTVPATSSKLNTTIIPGGSDVRYCAESRSTDLFSIERLEVRPTPPYLEEYLSVHVYGTFLKNITANATLDYRVNVNHGWDVIEGQMQFCDINQLIEQPDPDREMMCPPEKGFALISMSAWMFWWIGAANYSLRYDAMTHEGERIYCLEADFYLGCRNGREPDCREDDSQTYLTLQSGSI